jgi:hypothetical protein
MKQRYRKSQVGPGHPWPLIDRILLHKVLLTFACALSLGQPNRVYAELREYIASPRSLAMGGAGLAIVDDESALYVNPAGLAGQKDSSIHVADEFAEGSYNFVTDLPAFMTLMSGLTPAALNQMIGKNLTARSQTQAVLRFNNFAASLLFDFQGAFLSRNQALPNITIGYQTTTGGSVGAGFSLTRQHRRRKGLDVRVGANAKFGWRRGGYRDLPLTTLLAMTQGTALMNQVIGFHGFGWGLDVGTQISIPAGRSSLYALGVVLNDVGNTNFLLGGAGTAPDSTPQSLGVGIAYQSKPSRGMEFTLAADYKHILDTSVSWLMKTHFGVEFGSRAFKFSLGFNQLYWTAGVTFDLWIMRVTALTYSEELGSAYRQDEDRRVGLRIDIKL